MDKRRLVGYSPKGGKELDMTKYANLRIYNRARDRKKYFFKE